MTVTNSISRAEYDGNDSATEFGYGFKIFNDADLRVSLLEGEVETALILDTDYSVTGAGSDSGGNVVFSTPPATGQIVLIIREIEITQRTDLRNQGAYFPETVEDELDRSRMIDQQMSDDIRRSIRVPPGDDSGFDAELPRGIVGQSNRAVITNDDGTGFAVGPTSNEVANAQQYSEDALIYKNSAQQAEQSSVEAANTSIQQADRAESEADRANNNADSALQASQDNAGDIATNALDIASLVAVTATAFMKADGSQPAWTAPTTSTLETASTLAIVVGSTVVEIASGTAVTLPALAAGTDYTLYASDAGALQAVDADSAAPAGERKVGGFHASAGASEIVTNSLWDLNWRPKASPRAMVLDPGGSVWGDIYLTDVEYTLYGYSRNGQQIADDSDRPILPATVGGDGTTLCPSASWWQFLDIIYAAGKRYAIYEELVSLAYGVVERQAVGTDPGTTQHQAGHRSACGAEQITGVMQQWFSGASATDGSTYLDIAEGRGDVYASNMKAPRFGAYWSNGSSAGSRASHWTLAPDISSSPFGARALSDHLNLQAER